MSTVKNNVASFALQTSGGKHVAFDSQGNIYLIFVDDPNTRNLRCYKSTDGGNSFIDLGLPKFDSVLDASIVIDSDDIIHVITAEDYYNSSLNRRYFYIRHYYYSGGSWQTLTVYSDYQSGSTTRTLTVTADIDGSNNIHIVYCVYNYISGYKTYYRKYDGSAWGSPIDIANPPIGEFASPGSSMVAVDSRGDIHVVYPIVNTIRYFSNVSGTWQSKRDIATLTAGTICYRVRFVIGPNDTMHVVYAYHDGTQYVLGYLQSTDRGNTWSSPLNLPSLSINPHENYDVAVDNYNNLYVFAIDATNSSTIKMTVCSFGQWADWSTAFTSTYSLSGVATARRIPPSRQIPVLYVTWSGSGAQYDLLFGATDVIAPSGLIVSPSVVSIATYFNQCVISQSLTLQNQNIGLSVQQPVCQLTSSVRPNTPTCLMSLATPYVSQRKIVSPNTLSVSATTNQATVLQSIATLALPVNTNQPQLVRGPVYARPNTITTLPVTVCSPASVQFYVVVRPNMGVISASTQTVSLHKGAVKVAPSSSQLDTSLRIPTIQGGVQLVASPDVIYVGPPIGLDGDNGDTFVHVFTFHNELDRPIFGLKLEEVSDELNSLTYSVDGFNYSDTVDIGPIGAGGSIPIYVKIDIPAGINERTYHARIKFIDTVQGDYEKTITLYYNIIASKIYLSQERKVKIGSMVLPFGFTNDSDSYSFQDNVVESASGNVFAGDRYKDKERRLELIFAEDPRPVKMVLKGILPDGNIIELKKGTANIYVIDGPSGMIYDIYPYYYLSAYSPWFRSFNIQPVSSTPVDPITDVAYDGTSLWVLVGSYLYECDDDGWEVTHFNNDTFSQLNSITDYSSQLLLGTTPNGVIYSINKLTGVLSTFINASSTGRQYDMLSFDGTYLWWRDKTTNEIVQFLPQSPYRVINRVPAISGQFVAYRSGYFAVKDGHDFKVFKVSIARQYLYNLENEIRNSRGIVTIVDDRGATMRGLVVDYQIGHLHNRDKAAYKVTMSVSELG